jgi:hypothetical protein
MFHYDLEAVDALRRDAINVREPHLSGIKKLQVYAGQLVWIGGKFPLDVRNQCGGLGGFTIRTDMAAVQQSPRRRRR